MQMSNEQQEILKRLTRMEDLEAIRQVKFRYLRCIDNQLWAELRTCFTTDATTSYGAGEHSYEGIDAVVGFLESSLGKRAATGYLAMHQSMHPEIEFTGDSTARGVWALHSIGFDGSEEGRRHSFVAYYQDEYVKVNGEWKIRHTGYTPSFRGEWKIPGDKVRVWPGAITKLFGGR